ncbi:formyltransferase family protein [Paradesertivirga mongoliensis]|uniref:Formyltransferase family protein n=1 Tax=Paradesertivirga mongoliensis TaxID=2100740 RepID=A0ABW4ZJW8_9SPHI|nr:formyltransferase family protein [Pedobacter mongoliensis]
MRQNNYDKRIGLFLMTFKGLKVLEAIIESNQHYLISFVCVGDDKNLVEDSSQEIIALCIKNDIQYLNRKDYISGDKVKYLLAVSWRWMIESKGINLIVLHDSLLPRYRGFAPLVNALKNGEPSIGVTALFASENYDEGPIISQKSIKISYPIKIRDAIQLIASAYQALVLEILQTIADDIPLQSEPQDCSNATYSLWLSDNDYFIDWNWDAQYIERFINAVGFPYGGARTSLLDRTIRIDDAIVLPEVKIENRDVGKIIWFDNERPVIVCGRGLLRIDEAVFIDDNTSILPLKKFRIRLR